MQSEDTISKENLTDTARTASISSMEPARKYSKSILDLNILIMLHVSNVLRFLYPQFLHEKFAPAFRLSLGILFSPEFLYLLLSRKILS